MFSECKNTCHCPTCRRRETLDDIWQHALPGVLFVTLPVLLGVLLAKIF